MRSFDSIPSRSEEKKWNWPEQQCENPNRPAEAIDFEMQSVAPNAGLAEQFDPTIRHQKRWQRERDDGEEYHDAT